MAEIDPDIDPDLEARRLAELYASMEEVQLSELAAVAGTLTEEACEALEKEIKRRQLNVSLNTHIDASYPEFRKLLTVASFRDTPNALLAKGMLEGAGIECFLTDENLVRMDWFVSNAIGGIKLQVPEEQAEDAASILEQPIPESFDVETSEPYDQPRCPRCNSLMIEFSEVDKRVALTALWAISIPIPVKRNQWKCGACGFSWKNDPQKAEPGSSA